MEGDRIDAAGSRSARNPLVAAARWGVAWVLLSAVGAWAQVALLRGETRADGPAASVVGRGLLNLISLPTEAFALAVKIVLGVRTDRTLGAEIAGVLVGWACLLFGLWVVLCARHALATCALSQKHARKTEGPACASRRVFLLDGPLAFGGIVGSAGAVHSVIAAPFDLRVERYTVPVRGLARALDGMRLVQISDTHLGPHVPPEFIAKVVERSILLTPDLFVLTGDYVHRGTGCNGLIADLLRPLVETGRPVLGVLGNHDWYGDGRDVARCLEDVGVRMIDNARVYFNADTRHVSTEPTEACVCVAGLGDMSGDRMEIDAALGGVPEGIPRLVLEHQPDAAETPEIVHGPRIDLMLSGHTHGGQVRLPLIGAPVTMSRYGQKYARGLAQGPAFPVVVSRGIGMSFLPVRIGVPPEIVEVTLRAAEG